MNLYLIFIYFLFDFLSIQVWLFYWLVFFAGCYGVTLLVYFIYYIIYFIYVSFCAQKKFFFQDLWLPVVYLLFNVYIIFVFKL